MKQMDKNFTPGESVWVVERDDCGNVDDFGGYMCLGSACNFAIASAFVYGCDGLEEILQYYAKETANDFDVDLHVFPIEDCYKTKEEAESAFNKEME